MKERELANNKLLETLESKNVKYEKELLNFEELSRNYKEENELLKQDRE